MERRHPGLKAAVQLELTMGRVTMPSFELAPDNPIIEAIIAAYQQVRGETQPTGAITPLC